MIELKFSGATAAELFVSVLEFVSVKDKTPAPVQVYREAPTPDHGASNTKPGPAPVLIEEKKKVGRPPSKKPAAEKIEQPAPTQEATKASESQGATPQTPPLDTPSIKYPTHEEALAAIKAITDKHGMKDGIPIGRGCLNRMGYERVSEVKEEDRYEFINLCNEANRTGRVPTKQ